MDRLKLEREHEVFLKDLIEESNQILAIAQEYGNYKKLTEVPTNILCLAQKLYQRANTAPLSSHD